MLLFPAALLTAALGTGGEFSVVLTERVSVDARTATALVEELASALATPEARLGKLVAPKALLTRLKGAAKDPLKCAGDQACFRELGRAGGLAKVVSLSLLSLGGELQLELVLVDVASGALVKSVAASAPAGTKPDLRKLAQELLSAVAPPDPPPPPPLVVAEPDPLARAPAVRAQPAPGLSLTRKVSVGLGAGAVVTVGLGVVLGVTALRSAEALRKTSPTYAADQRRVQSFALLANLSYGTAAALAAGAVICWVVGAPPPPVTVAFGPWGAEVRVHVAF